MPAIPCPPEGLIVSRTSAQYRKPSRSAASRPGAASRHRKSSPGATWRRGKTTRIAAAAVVASALLVTAWPAATHLLVRASDLAWVGQADALGMQLASSLGIQAAQQPQIVSVGVAVGPGYLNPLRSVSGLTLERIDMGVDFGGSGPVYALGNAVITNATGTSGGWPGGGWITYRLTDGPAAGLTVYLAEDVKPTVQVGQHVSSATVIASMFAGGDGIEIGWAQQSGLSAESQLPEAGSVGGNGPFPTRIGLNFEELLESLGVPAAPNRTQAPYGILPPGYPAVGG
jgi:murein DD-endopeptidase MepM/ murein hydrolase activator NlpD